MRKIASMLTVLMLFSVLAFAQTRTVTGIVRDDKGDAIPFATVTEVGTKNAVQADANGNFIIKMAENGQLSITAAGFGAQTISVTGNTATVSLTRGEGQLQEVVVTALGIKRTRNQVPYAAQQVGGDEVSKSRTSNFMQNLSGKISGLEMRQANTLGGSTNVVLRGTKTISNSNQALFVIDGVPVDNSQVRSGGQTTGRGGYDYGSAAADINPDDIASITVLKGAASTALYGARGGNGVILITTKKGTRGLGITMNSGITVGKYDKSTFLKYQNEYGGGYGRYYEDPSGYFLYRDINGDGTKDLVVPVSEDASFGARFDPNKMVYQWDAFDPTSPNFGKPRPWVAAANGPASIFQTQVSSNQSVYLDGGSDRGSFKLGYTRNDDKGIMPNSKITKNMVNFGGTYNITPKFVANASVNFTNQEGRGRYGTGYDDKNLMTNFRQWWQTNVDILEQKEAYYRNNKANTTWNWADPTDLVPIYWDNPYFTRYENYETDARNRILGIAGLNYKVSNALNLLGRVSHDTYTEFQEERQAVGSVTTSNYSRNNRNYYETNYDLIGNVDKDINNDINFKGLFGVNVRKKRSQSIFSSTNGGLIVERIYSLSNSKSAPVAPSESDARTEFFSQFAGATFTWKDMITVDGTVRHDAFSTLPKGDNDAYYPSVSAGFTFSKLLPSATWLSYGKLRGNYARVGNGGENPYLTADVYNIGTPFGSAALVSVAGIAANPNLKIEETESKEFGIEASFLKNRIGFDVTYYNATTFNQIFNVPVSVATGYSSKNLNAGSVRNKGWEVSLNGAPVQTKDFTWNVNVNWTRNRNVVEELFKDEAGNEVDNIILGSFQGGVTLNASKGLPYGTIRGTDFTYVNGQPIISQTTGYPVRTTTSNNVIGDVNPDWIGGINNALRYKNVSLSWLVDMRKGGDVFSLDMYYGLATGLYPETAGLNDLGNPSRDPVASGGGVILPGVDATGKPNTKRASNTNYGLFGYARQPNKQFVYDASFIKLREAVLTYSLPKALVSKVPAFKGIDVSLIGRNLWLIHKNTPYSDPEEIVSAGNLQGYQVGAYPSVRTLAFNLKLRF